MRTDSHIDRYGLIIGAMKSGTTSLFRYLARHPQVAAASDKEMNFFADDEHWERGLDWYEAHFDWDASQHRIALEASTHYTKRPEFPNAAERIARIDASFQFIYLVREPVARIESHLTHGLYMGWLAERKHVREHQHALDLTRYAYQLDAYLEHFERSDILVLRLCDLRDAPSRTVRRVCEFLDLSTEPDLVTSRRYNTSRSKTKPSMLWQGIEALGPLANLAREKFSLDTRRWLGEPVERQRLTDEERRYVRRALADDHRRLAEEYGIEPFDHAG
ncbi:MAG: sulfotransferase family protein [Persicimonas sp.]